MRKLASIQLIRSLEVIEGADAIEKASVLGWQLVVKKGEFQVGDLCVYCEIDSVMPERPEFEFLKPRGMRIKTIRLREQVSQGICFPLSILPDGIALEENTDCTDILRITKYEPPIPACLSGVVKGKFPSFIPKTDETRVQVLQQLLSKYRGEKCYISEKLDGSSATFYINNHCCPDKSGFKSL
jgi:RNA ligase (TIGR02306 family)